MLEPGQKVYIAGSEDEHGIPIKAEITYGPFRCDNYMVRFDCGFIREYRADELEAVK